MHLLKAPAPQGFGAPVDYWEEVRCESFVALRSLPNLRSAC